MSFPQLGTALAGAAFGSLLMPKPQVPNITVPAPPTIVVPNKDDTASPMPMPANAPLSPTTMSDTAALRRARANRQIQAGGGPSELILSRSRSRQETSAPTNTSGGGLVTRTTLLGR